MRPSQIPDGRPVTGRPPWYSFPLASIIEIIDPIAWGLRTLPDDQLEAELSQLTAICAEPDYFPAHRLMRLLYGAEAARRADPAQRFDAELSLALGRLERATNDADRQLVRDIGQKLFDIGGQHALRKAEQRMLALVKPDKQDLRRHVIARRWAGIGGGK